MNKKELDKFKMEMLKQKIESEGVALDRYVKAIVRSAFLDCCTGGAYFNDLYHTALRHGYDALEKSKKPKKEKDELRRKWFPLFFEGQDELERMSSNLKYQKNLTSWAKTMLSNLSDEKKEKMIRDCITQQEMWSEMMNRNSKLIDKLKEKPKKIVKVKK